jgi:DHA1 family quinolone resistance protein-like MFS transporter
LSISPPGASLKPGAIQLLTQGAIFSTWMYIVVVAKNELGLDDTSIAYVAAMFAATTFFSNYLFGRASDYYGRRIFLFIGLSASAVAFLLQIFIFDFWSYLGFRVLTGVCIGIFPAALIAYVHESKRKLGSFSSFGAMGWLVGMIISGVIAQYLFLRSVFLLSSIMFFMAFLISFKLPPIKHKPIRVPLFPKKILKKNLAIYLGVLIRHSGANLMWVFWPLYLQTLGANLLWIGLITAINAISQTVMMYFIIDRIDCKKSIYLGLFLSGATFLSFAFAQNYIQLLPSQIFLGMSWSFMYVGAIIYLNKYNEERGTATGILTSILNLSSLIGSIFAVFLIALFGDYRWIIVCASIMAFTGLVVFSILNRSDDSK